MKSQDYSFTEFFQSTISVLIVLIFIGSLSIVFFYGTDNDPALSGWQMYLYQAMTWYLIFITFRSFILIIFSFYSSVNKKGKIVLKSYPLVTLIVPCYNEEKVVETAIKSVLELNYPNYEILVIDDGSKDRTLEEASKLDKKGRIRTIYQENTGKSGALNRGISEANGEYVFCMDADSKLDPNVLIYGISYFQQNPNLCAVAGAVIVGNKDNFISMFQYLEYTVGLNFHKMAQNSFSLVTIVPGPVGLFKRRAIVEIGGYHHDTFAEDCDLTIRLLMKGFEIEYCPDMQAVTEVPDDYQQLIGQRYRWSRGIVQAILKHSYVLTNPIKYPRGFIIIYYMLLESIFIPILNFAFAFATIEHVLIYKNSFIFGPYFISLLILDIALALYCVVLEKEKFILVFLATISKVTYGLSLEILRFFAILDEALKLPMKWGTLVRKGLK